MAVSVERTTANYRDARNLRTRVNLYEHRFPVIDPVAIAAELMPADPRLVLDVGCGYGRYVRRLRDDHPRATVVGIDASPGMLGEVDAPVMIADAQAIPYPDGCADAVLAMHRLYHVPDIAKAVGEFRRVLKPGGTLLVSTNVEDDMAAYFGLLGRALAKALGDGAPPANLVVRDFDSGNAPAYLGAEFDSVEAVEHLGTVKVPEPGPLLSYLDSTRSFFGIDAADFDAVLAAVAVELEAHFEAHEHFEFDKGLVFYRCR